MIAIVAAAAVRVRVPLRRPLVTSRGAWVAADSWLVQLQTADGRTGVGEATLGPGADPTDQADLDARVRTLVDEPGAAPAAWDSAVTEPPTPEPSAADLALRAALAGAWLDLGAGAHGPRASSVAVNALIGAETLHASVAAARDAVAAGFTTLKLKGGGEASTAELVERLMAVRAAVGAAVGLRLDVNGAWSSAVAAERLAALRPVGLELVEQPVAAGPGASIVLARLRSASGAALAADESVTSARAAAELLEAGAVDVLVVKPARVGGPAAALAIAASAGAVGAGVVISTLLETGVGLRTALVTAALLPAGGLDRAHGLATGPLLATDLVQGGGVTVAAGRAACPAGPGLALTLDAAAIERSAIERLGAWA